MCETVFVLVQRKWRFSFPLINHFVCIFRIKFQHEMMRIFVQKTKIIWERERTSCDLKCFVLRFHCICVLVHVCKSQCTRALKKINKSTNPTAIQLIFHKTFCWALFHHKQIFDENLFELLVVWKFNIFEISDEHSDRHWLCLQICV